MQFGFRLGNISGHCQLISILRIRHFEVSRDLQNVDVLTNFDFQRAHIVHFLVNLSETACHASYLKVLHV